MMTYQRQKNNNLWIVLDLAVAMTKVIKYCIES
jgi:hypothetical protein